MKSLGLSGVVVVVGLVACGGDANVEGNYTANVTYGENGCTIPNWDTGASLTGIPVLIRQEGESVSAEVQGAAGFGLGLLLSSNVFVGSVDGDDIDLKIVGAASFRSGDCAYTFDAQLRGTLDGDALSGDILYRAVTTDHVDCGALRGCVSVQQYNGTRPP